MEKRKGKRERQEGRKGAKNYYCTKRKFWVRKCEVKLNNLPKIPQQARVKSQRESPGAQTHAFFPVSFNKGLYFC